MTPADKERMEEIRAIASASDHLMGFAPILWLCDSLESTWAVNKEFEEERVATREEIVRLKDTIHMAENCIRTISSVSGFRADHFEACARVLERIREAKGDAK